MASRASPGRNGSRVPFGDATSRANTPSTSYAQHAGKQPAAAYVENTGVPAAGKLSASLSAVAAGAVAGNRHQQTAEQERYRQMAAQQLAEQQYRQTAEQQYYQQLAQQQYYEQLAAQQAAQDQTVALDAQAGHYADDQQAQTAEVSELDADCDMTDAPPLDPAETSNRNSAASGNSKHESQYSSCDGFPNKKTHIGPWQLGKTLGKGSSARVRAARHRVTHQPVAVKIIAKKTARMTQSGSIAQLDQTEVCQPENVDGVRRMPMAIEREVAILKLIEHPNIMKLYDIWENRNEIYLILEFVENGDLFTYVTEYGPLSEEASLYVFRQMMSAVQYCHAYNICHRDLKPENILLKSDGKIKIADFGMAALHQGPRSHLQTPCGSPHYAAPELLKSRPYRGDKADIWSMGVILFVMLAGRLPFDEDDLSLMLAKAKKGIYTMPSFFSPDAKDLIHRILQIEPSVRISMRRMWQHPLVWKYGYLDDLGADGTEGQGQGGGRGTQVTPLDLATIDTQIFRQLRSMWHTLREDELAGKLVSNEPNDQKLFYWLLYNYRERQQENYNPTLTHSMSDYHHVNKPVYSKKVSTRQFSQSTPTGHKRSVSRFTVISNVAETEAGSTENGTIKSYDPYKSSIVMQPSEARASSAKIVVHRNNPNVEAEVRSMVQAEAMKAKASAAATKKKVYVQPRRGSAAYLKASRGSMSSIRSTRSMRSVSGKPGVVRPSSRHKRGVDFSRARKTSINETAAAAMPTHVPAASAEPVVTSANTASAAAAATAAAAAAAPSREDTLLWNEDLTDFSCKIAKDLDDAFMSSLLAVDAFEEGEGRNSPFSIRLNTSETTVSPATTATSSQVAVKPSAGSHPWDSRPLPPSPPRSDSVQLEILKAKARTERARQKTKAAAAAGASLQEAVSIGVATSSDAKPHQRTHAADVQSDSLPLVAAERRVVSAPVHSQGGSGKGAASRQLASIREAGQESWPLADKDKPRAVSAPSKGAKSTQMTTALENEGLTHLAQAENTIRLVVSPSAPRTKALTATPRPVSLPKRIGRDNERLPSTAAMATRPVSDPQPEMQAFHAQQPQQQASRRRREERAQRPVSETILEEASGSQAHHDSISASSDRSSMLPMRRSWFRRQSKTDMRSSQDGEAAATLSATASASSSGAVPPQALSRKKSFIFPFWKTSKSDSKMAAAAGEGEEEVAVKAEAGEGAAAERGPKQSVKATVVSTTGNSRTGSSRSKDSRSKSRATAHASWHAVDDEPNGRKIDPQQNWLSRLFRVKPATRHLCLGLSQRRARQEVVQLLREWRRFGLRDIEVDKERSIVFARVASDNYLGIREVAFACEIITVIEHGKRNHLSILRLTQEKGSANSFHKVADTIKAVMRERQLVVPDKRKVKMMIKTLNS